MTTREAAMGLLIGLPATGCAVPLPQDDARPAEARPGEVGLKYVGPGDAALTVPVSINGQGPFTFVLDTGATLTCVDTELARKLELPDQPGVTGRGATLGGAGGMRLVSFESLQVGSASATDLMGCVLDLQQLEVIGKDIRGLLGLNFLRSYRVLLDFPRKTLELQTPVAAEE